MKSLPRLLLFCAFIVALLNFSGAANAAAIGYVDQYSAVGARAEFSDYDYDAQSYSYVSLMVDEFTNGSKGAKPNVLARVWLSKETYTWDCSQEDCPIVSHKTWSGVGLLPKADYSVRGDLGAAGLDTIAGNIEAIEYDSEGNQISTDTVSIPVVATWTATGPLNLGPDGYFSRYEQDWAINRAIYSWREASAEITVDGEPASGLVSADIHSERQSFIGTD